VLKLHQKNVLAVEVSSCEGAELIVTEHADILERHEILAGPWWGKSHARKKFPSVAVGVIDRRWRSNYGTPPPARACAKETVLYIVTPSLRIAAVHHVPARAQDSVVVPFQIRSQAARTC